MNPAFEAGSPYGRTLGGGVAAPRRTRAAVLNTDVVRGDVADRDAPGPDLGGRAEYRRPDGAERDRCPHDNRLVTAPIWSPRRPGRSADLVTAQI